MYRTVPSHDLAGECERSCGGSLRELSLRTNISEYELREFSAGRLALSAMQRLHIIVEVAHFKDRWISGINPVWLEVIQRHEPQPDQERVARFREALDTLWNEAIDEYLQTETTKHKL
jgi:hypothetical protein